MRRLIIITNNGGEGNFLPGVAIDKQNYLDFFRQPESGWWQDEEIQCYDNTCSEVVLRSYIFDLRMTLRLDYVVLVFCGHGYTNNQGQQMFELSPGNEISIQLIEQLMSYTRCLMIADSCRTIVRMEDGGRIPGDKMFTESCEDVGYKEQCRRIYHNKFMQMAKGAFCIGRATSLNQSAREDAQNGGVYSYALLRTARDMIACRRKMIRKPNYDPVVSFSYIHSLARETIRQMTNSCQCPECNTIRGSQPPFVVIP